MHGDPLQVTLHVLLGHVVHLCLAPCCCNYRGRGLSNNPLTLSLQESDVLLVLFHHRLTIGQRRVCVVDGRYILIDLCAILVFHIRPSCLHVAQRVHSIVEFPRPRDGFVKTSQHVAEVAYCDGVEKAVYDGLTLFHFGVEPVGIPLRGVDDLAECLGSAGSDPEGPRHFSDHPRPGSDEFFKMRKLVFTFFKGIIELLIVH